MTRDSPCRPETPRRRILGACRAVCQFRTIRTRSCDRPGGPEIRFRAGRRAAFRAGRERRRILDDGLGAVARDEAVAEGPELRRLDAAALDRVAAARAEPAAARR